MKQLTSLLGNSQRLDGGAMFGNAPRALWQRWIAPDELNRIPLACRCLLVEDDGKKILFETGIGAFFEPAMRERFGVVEDEHVLLSSLADCGLAPEEIDVVVLSHLHFDHAGGTLSAWSEDAPPRLVFGNAHYVVSAKAWNRAQHPHPRDRASFIPGLCELIEATGRLELVGASESSSDARQPLHSTTLGAGYRFHLSDGHTPGLLLAEIEMPDGPIVFAADLIPGRPWVHLPITMGYDRFPERLIEEKRGLLEDLLGKRGRLFFTHDPEIALSRVHRDDKGKFSATEDKPALRALTQ